MTFVELTHPETGKVRKVRSHRKNELRLLLRAGFEVVEEVVSAPAPPVQPKPKRKRKAKPKRKAKAK